MIRLFRAHSLMPMVTEGPQAKPLVPFEWFCVRRAQPVAPYERLIMDYDRLQDPARGAFKMTLESYVDQLLTGIEIEALTGYLTATLGLEVAAEEAPLPVRFLDWQLSFLLNRPKKGIQFWKFPEDVRFCKLSEFRNYALPIAIWGRPDWSEVGWPTCQGHDAHGIRYLQKALTYLGMASEITPARLALLVQVLRNEEGLVVSPRRQRRAGPKSPPTTKNR
jgi:hypothetical protein